MPLGDHLPTSPRGAYSQVENIFPGPGGSLPNVHRKKSLTRSELGPNDLGALGGSRQGHCQGWDGDLGWVGWRGEAGSEWRSGGVPCV